MRMKIYMESKERVAKHNADYEKGLTTYKMGINHFADRVSIYLRTYLSTNSHTMYGVYLEIVGICARRILRS